MLSSFPFLLAGMLAVSAMSPSAAWLDCSQLDPQKDHLEQMKICKGEPFWFSSNSAVPFVLTGLDQATADNILYVKDSQTNTKMPRMFKGPVTIKDSTVERLTLFIGSVGFRQDVKIINNPSLKKFTLLPYLQTPLEINLIVKGNNRLSMPSIAKLHKISEVKSFDIQEYKECFFDSKPLGSLAQLDGCTGVEGDLIIGSQTKTTNIPPIRIEQIRNGCLRIEKSSLTNLEFLEGLLDSKAPETCSDQSQNRYIKGNTQLCLTSEEQIRWEDYKLTYTGTCDDRCTADFASTNPTKPCQIVTGDVKITGNVDPTKLKHWDRITVLEGTLEVDNTDLAEIEIFKNLKEIKNPSKFKRALTVTRNSKMKKFNLPKLKSITQQPDAWQGPVLFHQNNPAFKLSWPKYQKWQNITREKSPQIPGDGPPIDPTTPSPPGSTTLSQEQIRHLNKINAEANEQTYYNGKWAMWISGVVIVLLIIGVIAVIIYCNWDRLCRCFRRCSQKRKTQQEGYDADHGIKKPAGKKGGAVRRRAPSKDKRDTEKEELTVALNADDYELSKAKKTVFKTFLRSYNDQEYARACQMARDAVEMPFKMSDIITNIHAGELNFKWVPPPTPEEKIWPKCYRFGHNSCQWLAFNPDLINIQKTQELNGFDPHAVLKVLLTNFNEFFVTNFGLITDTTNYLSGPYYGGKSKNLLAKIDGPVTLATGIHSMLDMLQVILNIDFNESNGNKSKVHPAFRQKYVFLGDYVDRGDLGLECSVLLCLLARLFPGNFVILRGNHDQRVPIVEHCWNEHVEQTINRWGNALRKPITNSYHLADCSYWDYVEKVVAHLPYPCLINGKVFACHGGLSLSMLQMKGTLDELFGKSCVVTRTAAGANPPLCSKLDCKLTREHNEYLMGLLRTTITDKKATEERETALQETVKKLNKKLNEMTILVNCKYVAHGSLMGKNGIQSISILTSSESEIRLKASAGQFKNKRSKQKSASGIVSAERPTTLDISKNDVMNLTDPYVTISTEDGSWSKTLPVVRLGDLVRKSGPESATRDGRTMDRYSIELVEDVLLKFRLAFGRNVIRSDVLYVPAGKLYPANFVSSPTHYSSYLKYGCQAAFFLKEFVSARAEFMGTVNDCNIEGSITIVEL